MHAEVEGFAQFVEIRQRALQRTAWLLTGDWALAEDLVQTALVRSWPRWERIRRRDDPEVYVRRVMVNTWASWSGGTLSLLCARGEAPVTTGPGDGMAGTAGRGRLRASHTDREHVIDTLKAAFVQGRLTKDEFDMRVGQALVSRTYSELATLTADIPAGLIGAQPLRKPARAQACPPMNNGAKSGAWALIVAAALVASLSSGDGGLFFFVAVCIFMSLLGSRGPDARLKA